MTRRPSSDCIVVRRIREQASERMTMIRESGKTKLERGEVIGVVRGTGSGQGGAVVLDIKVGDRIVFAKYSGSGTRPDGTEYLITHEDDILGVLDAAGQTEKVED